MAVDPREVCQPEHSEHIQNRCERVNEVIPTGSGRCTGCAPLCRAHARVGDQPVQEKQPAHPNDAPLLADHREMKSVGASGR